MLILKDAIVVFTGSLHTMTRSEAKQAVERMGGTVAGSVSPKTTFVVVGPGAYSKLREAEKLNIKTMDEEAFLFMIKENN